MNQSGNKLETNLYAPFIIHDFEVSWNNQIISEEVCAENKDTLIGQPVLVKYFNEGDASKDHLGTHEAYFTKNRDTGEELLATDTFAIGTFQSAEIEDVEIDGQVKRCLVGYAQLWVNRYYNVCSLLNEWLDRGIKINCSCEYTFKNYEMIDSVQHIKSPYSYTGHTILNSEEKDGYGVVLPAYDVAEMLSWNTALRKDMDNENSENEASKVENIFVTSLNGLSLGATRDGIYEALANVMTAKEYMRMYISDYSINENDFLYEVYNEEAESWETYKVSYSKSDEGVTVDYENRVKMECKVEMVPAEEAKNQLETAVNEAKAEMQTTIDELTNKVSETETELNSVREDNVAQKETVVSLNEKIVELNETIEGLNEYKEKFEAEQYAAALNEALEKYKAKFVKLNALDKFEAEEVQVLVAETLDAEKALDAKNTLSDMLIELIDNAPVQNSMNAKEPKGNIENGSGLGKLLNGQKKVIKDTDIYNGLVVL
jgi:hypothetical protein